MGYFNVNSARECFENAKKALEEQGNRLASWLQDDLEKLTNAQNDVAKAMDEAKNDVQSGSYDENERDGWSGHSAKMAKFEELRDLMESMEATKRDLRGVLMDRPAEEEARIKKKWEEEWARKKKEKEEEERKKQADLANSLFS